MIKRLASASFALCCLVWLTGATWLPLFKVPVVTYQGPGDVKPGADAWWGLRAYNAAAIGSSCIDIKRASDSTTQTFVTLANGGVDTASITTFLAATTGIITKWYDQTGNGHPLSSATAAKTPAYTASAIGSLPGATFNLANFVAAGSSVSGISGGSTTTGTFSTVTKRTTVASFSGVVEMGNSGMGWQGSGLGLLFQGNTPSFTLSENTFHAVQAVMNGASSVAYVDGSSLAVANPGATAMTGNYSIGQINGGNSLDGLILEAGFWNLLFSAGDQASMNSNQHAYWGF